MAESCSDTSLEGRMCWVCFATEEDDYEAPWVTPCRCRGTTKWVHQSCLQRWIDEKQKGNSGAKVACPKCNTDYKITFPKMDTFVLTLHLVDRIHLLTSPYITGSLVLGGIYWFAASYGAFTIVQVLGMEEGRRLLDEQDMFPLAVTLPMIPVGLIVCNMNVTRWEDWILSQWRRNCASLPIINKLFPNTRQVDRIPAEQQPVGSDVLSFTRLVSDSLMLPSIITVIGKVFFSSLESRREQLIVGGVTFLFVRGFLKMYYKQSQYVRQAKRVVSNFEESQ